MQESSKNIKQKKYKLYKMRNFKALGKDKNIFVTEEQGKDMQVEGKEST